MPRQCVDEVDPKLQEPSSFKLWTLRETWTEDSFLDCLRLVDQTHVIRKICWKMVHQGRHILIFTCGSATNCATALTIVKVRQGHTTRPVIQVVPGHTIVYVQSGDSRVLGLRWRRLSNREPLPISFEQALLIERTALGHAIQNHDTISHETNAHRCRYPSSCVPQGRMTFRRRRRRVKQAFAQTP